MLHLERQGAAPGMVWSGLVGFARLGFGGGRLWFDPGLADQRQACRGELADPNRMLTVRLVDDYDLVFVADG